MKLIKKKKLKILLRNVENINITTHDVLGIIMSKSIIYDSDMSFC